MKTNLSKAERTALGMRDALNNRVEDSIFGKQGLDYIELSSAFSVPGAPQRRHKARRDATWANNDAEVFALLRRVFPNAYRRPGLRRAGVMPNQYKRMKAWLTAIRCYFRLNYTTPEVAAQLGITYQAARSLIRNIRRAQAGRTSNHNEKRRRKVKVVNGATRVLQVRGKGAANESRRSTSGF